MRNIYRNCCIALAVIIGLTACGNAGAGNNRKTTEKKTAVVELSESTFNEKVYDMTKEGLEYLGELPAIVDFTATWCGPCKKLAPILEELAVEYDGKIAVYKVDVDKCRNLAGAFNISSIPAVLFIPAKGEPSMTVGLRNKAQLQQQIETMLLK